MLYKLHDRLNANISVFPLAYIWLLLYSARRLAKETLSNCGLEALIPDIPSTWFVYLFMYLKNLAIARIYGINREWTNTQLYMTSWVQFRLWNPHRFLGGVTLIPEWENVVGIWCTDYATAFASANYHLWMFTTETLGPRGAVSERKLFEWRRVQPQDKKWILLIRGWGRNSSGLCLTISGSLS